MTTSTHKRLDKINLEIERLNLEKEKINERLRDELIEQFKTFHFEHYSVKTVIGALHDIHHVLNSHDKESLEKIKQWNTVKKHKKQSKKRLSQLDITHK